MVIKRRNTNKTKGNVINLDDHRKDIDIQKECGIEARNVDATICGDDIEGVDAEGCASTLDAGTNPPPPLSSAKQGNIPYEAIIEALEKSNGLVTIAAKLLGVNFRTLVKYIQKNKKLQEHLYEIDEHMKDKVQNKLYEKIDKGDAGAMYFYLKCKAKDRGFIESATHINPPQIPITFNYKLVMPNYPDTLQSDKVIEIEQETKQIEHKDDKDTNT